MSDQGHSGLIRRIHLKISSNLCSYFTNAPNAAIAAASISLTGTG